MIVQIKETIQTATGKNREVTLTLNSREYPALHAEPEPRFQAIALYRKALQGLHSIQKETAKRRAAGEQITVEKVAGFTNEELLAMNADLEYYPE